MAPKAKNTDSNKEAPRSQERGAVCAPMNCQLPGAELLEQGKSVDEIMAVLEQKHAGGRPTIKTKELTDKILLELMEGKSLVKICKQDGMPAYSSVCLWLAQDKEFSESYVRARDVQADYIFDEALDIADDSSEDEILTDDGRRLLNKEFVARSKLRVETRLRMAGKLAPKKYGDKLELDNKHSGKVDGPVLNLTLNGVKGGS